MSENNPYAKYLDGRPVEEILAATGGELAALLDALGPERATEAPAPGKWSAAEILCHLADCELVFAFRLRQTLAEPHPTIQPFDQARWAEHYGSVPAEQALDLFRTARAWNLRLLAAVLPGAADRPVTHPERGTMTFGTIVETMAGHDLNHLGQLRWLAGEAPAA
ncbi:MAG: DinB family protein [Terracidiphilus sp.]